MPYTRPSSSRTQAPRRFQARSQWVVAGIAGVFIFLLVWGPGVVTSFSARPLYYESRPELTAMVRGGDGQHVLHLGIQVMGRDPAVLRRFQEDEPQVRAGLVTVMTQQDYGVLRTAEGRNQLRAALRTKTRALMQAMAPGDEPISELYYTQFILQ